MTMKKIIKLEKIKVSEKIKVLRITYVNQKLFGYKIITRDCHYDESRSEFIWLNDLNYVYYTFELTVGNLLLKFWNSDIDAWEL